MATIEAITRPAATSTTSVDQLSLPSLVALSLVPGALVTASFVAAAPLTEALGFPPISALLASIVLVLVPLELGVVLWAGRGQGGALAAVPYRQSMPLRRWLWLVPTLIVLAFLGFGLHMPIEPTLIDGLFGWLPGWFVAPIDPDRDGDFTRNAWIVTIAAYVAINGLLGPIVEELYFRGFLLPRMERFGRWAPLLNVTLFSLYHFWSPWQLIARIVGIGPTVYAVRATRNVWLGAVVHCSLNTLGVLLVAMLVFGRL
ncbi:MAG: CPBP family intramembrane glutamic endopeptidase [Chloroflexota bacterium]